MFTTEKRLSVVLEGRYTGYQFPLKYTYWTMLDMVKYRAVSFKKDQIAAMYFTMSDIVHKLLLFE